MQLKLLTYLLFISFSARSIYGQLPSKRNQQVFTLNAIVDYMNEASRIQQQVYFDITRFAGAYTNNLQKNNVHLWHVSVKPGRRLKSGDFHLYKALTPDKDGYIDDYQSAMLPLYRVKKVLSERISGYPVENEPVNHTLAHFQRCFDSLECTYKKMVDYVNNQRFTTDTGFTDAGRILYALQPLLEKYNTASAQLYGEIERYYATFTPLETQPLINAAQKELLQSVHLIEAWRDQLYNGDDSRRHENDSLLRSLNKQGQSLADHYLSGTYGFNQPNNGAFPHTRYLTFYRNMTGTIFWFKSDTTHYFRHMPREYETYNKFVNRYNWVIHYYNQFTECSDGLANAENMDYSPEMAARLGADTAQNVLLKKPRIGYRFAWVMPEQEDEAQQQWRQMILSADPHHTVYLLDVSNSMREEHTIDTLKKGLKSLVQLQRETDRISIVTFGDSSDILIRFSPCNEKETIFKIIDNLQVRGATNAEAAVNDGYQLVDGSIGYKGKTKLLIITDGQFALSGKSKRKIRRYQSKGISLSILLLGNRHDPETTGYFRLLCKDGNGNFYDMRKHHLPDVLVKEAAD